MPFSTFHSIETGKSSLLSHQKGIATIGHNIANQSNEDYSRQRIQLNTKTPIDMPGITSNNRAGQVGQGVYVSQVERIRDSFIDDKIMTQESTTSYWQTKEFYLRGLESLYNEPAGEGIKGMFDRFLTDLNNLGNFPTEAGARLQVKTSAKELTQQINKIYEDIVELRKRADEQIRDHVSTINQKAKEIAKLNKQIALVKADGKNPNDLMDTRDALIEDISKLVNVNVTRKDQDFLVYIGAQVLVHGENYRELKTVGNPNNEGMSEVLWADNDLEAVINDGEMRGLMDFRDDDAVRHIEMMDTFAANLVTTVNDLHKEGFGFNGQTGIDFFSYKDLPMNLNGDFDSNGDGIADSTAIMKVSGSESMNLKDRIGIRGTINLGLAHNELRALNAEIDRLSTSNNPMDVARREVLERKRDSIIETDSIKVEYFETDTVHDVIDRINASEANVVAYLNHKGQFTIKALHNDQRLTAYSEYANTPDFAIRHLEDSGKFLTTFTGILSESGEQGAFNWGATGAISSFNMDTASGAFKVQYDVAPMKHAAGYISLSSDIEADHNNIATRIGNDNTGDGIPDTPEGVHDGSNIWKILSSLVSENERNQLSDFKDKLDSDIVMIDKSNNNFQAFINRAVQDAGTSTSEAVHETRANEVQNNFWKNKRKEISGVSLDEELATMLTYEHAYRAAARIINVVDSMIDTVINRMGA